MNDDERDCFRPMLNGNCVTDDKIDRNYIKAVSVAVVTPFRAVYSLKMMVDMDDSSRKRSSDVGIGAHSFIIAALFAFSL